MIAAGTRFTVVLSGNAWIFAPISNFWGEDLKSRALAALQASGGASSVQMEDIAIDASYPIVSILQDQQPYIATVKCRTSVDFATVTDAASWVVNAFATAAGLMPTASVTAAAGQSTGAPTPTAQPTILGGLGDSLQALVDSLQSLASGSKLVVWALVAGAVVFVGLVVLRPEAARSSVKVFR